MGKHASTRITYRLSPEELDKVKAAAEAEGVNVHEFTRRCVFRRAGIPIKHAHRKVGRPKPDESDSAANSAENA